MGTSPRPLRTALIAAFLGLQVALPLTYYFGDGGDDERFSWRMFSTTRVLRCRVAVLEEWGSDEQPQQRPVDLEADVQVAWISMLRRNRPAVVESYLERRCELSEADRTRYRRSCVRADGQALPMQEVAMSCSDGLLTREGDP